MIKLLKYLGSGIGLVVFTLVAYVTWRLYGLDAGMCGNQILGTYPSPAGTKKVVLFVGNCGATTGWSVHASIMTPTEELHDTDRGNIFVADANHGAAAEYNAIGGPSVQVVWSGNDELEIRYSRGARIFLELPQVGRTHISYSSF
jgi:hypothetical protein